MVDKLLGCLMYGCVGGCLPTRLLNLMDDWLERVLFVHHFKENIEPNVYSFNKREFFSTTHSGVRLRLAKCA